MCAPFFTSALKSSLHRPLSVQEPMCLVVLILSTHRRRNCLRETLLDESQVLVMSKYCHSHEVQVGPPGGTNGLDWQINRAISVVLNMSKSHHLQKLDILQSKLKNDP